MNKVFLLIFLLIVSGFAGAKPDEIILRAHGDDFRLGILSIDKDRGVSEITMRVVSALGFCRDAVIGVGLDESKIAHVDIDEKRWIYRIGEAEEYGCEGENRSVYPVKFSLANETDMREVDSALASILRMATSGATSNHSIFDNSGVLECIFRNKWRVSDIYSDFLNKLDENGNEMEQRMPSVVFHVTSNSEVCKEAYVLVFFPRGARRAYFFVTSATAIPL